MAHLAVFFMVAQWFSFIYSQDPSREYLWGQINGAWSTCEMIPSERQSSCGPKAARWRTSDTCYYEHNGNNVTVETQNCKNNQPYEVEKCYKYCSENCTWNKTQWEPWGECELEKDQGCGNGLRFRERGECLCGEKNEKQNASLCGLPPTQIQSCYVLCSNYCTYKENVLHYDVQNDAVATVNFSRLAFISKIKINHTGKTTILFSRFNSSRLFYGVQGYQSSTTGINPGSSYVVDTVIYDPPTQAHSIKFQTSFTIAPDRFQITVKYCNLEGRYTEWTSWSICKSEYLICNSTGVTERTRTCKNATKVTPGGCAGINIMKDWCLMPCFYWTEWINTTSCNLEQGLCGKGKITYQRNCSTIDKRYQNNSTFCNPSGRHHGVKQVDCNIPCYEFLSWGTWQPYNETDEISFYKRERGCLKENKTDADPSYCNGTHQQVTKFSKWYDLKPCSCGIKHQTRRCSGDCFDVDGLVNKTENCKEEVCQVFSEWSAWNTECLCEVHEQNRSRACTSNPCYNGGDLHGARNCTDVPLCIRAWSEWGDYSACSATCGGGKMESRRKCFSKQIDCIGKDVRTRDCGFDQCPVDGGFTNWSPWTSCSRSCGDGRRKRIRTCTNPPPDMGRNCTGAYDQVEVCNRGTCPGTYLTIEEFGSDCNRLCSSMNLSCSSDFSKFSINNSGITCKRSQDNETWTLEYHPSYNNETGECEGFTEIHNTKGCESVRVPEHHRRFCMCVRPEDVGYSSWSNWGECDDVCGFGNRSRSRVCLNSNGCPEGRDYDHEPCSDAVCPINGGYSPWEQWRECNASCGSSAVRERFRRCNNPPPLYGGKKCAGLVVQREPCNQHICPIHGGWSSWSNWTVCDKPCNLGTSYRRRKCTNPEPAFGGYTCEGNADESRVCNIRPCRKVHASFQVYFVKEYFYKAYDYSERVQNDLKAKILQNIREVYKNDHRINIEDVILNKIENVTEPIVTKKKSKK